MKNDSMDEELKKMTFSEHFDELRKRLWICLISILVLFLVCFIFKEPLKDIIIHPYESLRQKSIEDGKSIVIVMFVVIKE